MVGIPIGIVLTPGPLFLAHEFVDEALNVLYRLPDIDAVLRNWSPVPVESLDHYK